MGRLAFRPIILPMLLAPLAAWGLHWGIRHGITDGADLWRRAEEVALFLSGNDPYSDPDLSYPPSAVPLFAGLIGPFSSDSLPTAWVVLNLVALAALAAGILRVWGQNWPDWLRTSFLLALAASKPVRAGIALGQFHLIPTALAVWSIPALASGHSLLAGLMVGVALVKPTMALPVLGIWLVRREWRALGAAIGAQAALTAVTSGWLGIPPWTLTREWLANARLQEAAGTIDVPTIVARIWPNAPVSGAVISIVVLVVGMGGLFVIRRASEATLMALGLFLAAVFAYHRHYDLVLLLPALAWMVERGRLGQGRGGILMWMVAGLFAALLILPSNPAPLRRFEAAYEVVFLTASYAVLATMIALHLRDPGDRSRRGVGSSELPRPSTTPELCGIR